MAIFYDLLRETVLVTAAAGATGLATVDLAANLFKCEVYHYIFFKSDYRSSYCFNFVDL